MEKNEHERFVFGDLLNDQASPDSILQNLTTIHHLGEQDEDEMHFQCRYSIGGAVAGERAS